MKTKKAANGWIAVIALLALVAFVGCDLAGYDITETENGSRKAKPVTISSTEAPPEVQWGNAGETYLLDSPIETFYAEEDWIFLVEEGGNYRAPVLGESPTHAQIGERFIGYKSSSYGLWAGQDHDAGTVIVTNDHDNFYITIDTNELADIAEYHVNAFSSLTEIPSKRPSPGLSPFKAEGVNEDSVEIVIPKSFFGSVEMAGSFYFIVHAALTYDSESSAGTTLAGETAYAGSNGTPSFDGKGAWFYVIGYSIKPVIEPIYKELETEGDDPGTWSGQTAWAGGTEGAGSSWWFYIDASSESFDENIAHPIYAGQKLVVGATASYAKSLGLLTIELGPNMVLKDGSETVKIKGYDVIPLDRPNAGPFPIKLDASDSLSDIPVGVHDYLAIHLDVLARI